MKSACGKTTASTSTRSVSKHSTRNYTPITLDDDPDWTSSVRLDLNHDRVLPSWASRCKYLLKPGTLHRLHCWYNDCRCELADIASRQLKRDFMMINKIAVIAAASLLTMSVASAQNAPPPGNVNPGSMKSGAEQTGAPNQPRSGSATGTSSAPMSTTGQAPAGRGGESSPSSTAGGATGTTKGGPNTPGTR